MAGGIYVLVSKSELLVLTRSATDGYSDNVDVPSLLEKSAYILIAVGSFILIISFVGCCGACTKNKCLLRIVSN
jgi:hypothetical protein